MLVASPLAYPKAGTYQTCISPKNYRDEARREHSLSKFRLAWTYVSLFFCCSCRDQSAPMAPTPTAQTVPVSSWGRHKQEDKHAFKSLAFGPWADPLSLASRFPPAECPVGTQIMSDPGVWFTATGGQIIGNSAEGYRHHQLGIARNIP